MLVPGTRGSSLPGAGAAASPGGRSPGAMAFPRATTTARSTAFSNSRTFPGQG